MDWRVDTLWLNAMLRGACYECLKPRPRWITCSLVKSAACRGPHAKLHPSGVQSLSLLRTVSANILVVSELWSTTGGFCRGDRDGAASVRWVLPSYSFQGTSLQVQ